MFAAVTSAFVTVPADDDVLSHTQTTHTRTARHRSAPTTILGRYERYERKWTNQRL